MGTVRLRLGAGTDGGARRLFASKNAGGAGSRRALVKPQREKSFSGGGNTVKAPNPNLKRRIERGQRSKNAALDEGEDGDGDGDGGGDGSGGGKKGKSPSYDAPRMSPKSDTGGTGGKGGKGGMGGKGGKGVKGGKGAQDGQGRGGKRARLWD